MTDFGFIYALESADHQIIYVELIFSNYFMDIDYKKMISEEYLPIGSAVHPGDERCPYSGAFFMPIFPGKAFNVHPAGIPSVSWPKMP